MKKKSVSHRVERYFKIASLVCSCCEEFAVIQDEDGNIVERIEDYGINTKEEWEIEMDKEIRWISKNQEDVLSILPGLQEEWSESCKALRHVLSVTNVN